MNRWISTVLATFREERIRWVFLVAIVSRASLLVVGAFAVATIGRPPHAPPPLSDSILLDLPNRWDSGWYIGIASGGYRDRAGHETRFDRVVFFPAYPLALRVTARALGVPRRVVPWSWVGVAISTLMFVGALTFVFRIAQHLSTESTAATTVLLVATYPFALFFGLAYTESLFLMTMAGAIYHAMVGRYGRSSFFGLVAGLTRPNGFLLSLVLSVWLIEHRRKSGPHRLAPQLAAMIAPIVGMLLYSAYLYLIAGDPFVWRTAQSTWGRTYFNVVGASGQMITGLARDGLNYVTSAPYEAMNFAGLVTALFGGMIAGWRLGWTWIVLVIVNVLPPLMVGGLISMGRFTSVLFRCILGSRFSFPRDGMPC